MRGFAIDIETSGMDLRKSSVLEIGAVYFDTGTLFDNSDPLAPERKVLHPRCIRHELQLWPRIDEGVNWDPATMEWHVNNGGWDRIGYFMEAKPERLASWQIGAALRQFVKLHHGTRPDKPSIIGKNFGKFDWQFLNRITNGAMDDVFDHRIMDIGNILFDPSNDIRIPSTSECLARCGLRPHSLNQHTALKDCHETIDMLEVVIQEGL